MIHGAPLNKGNHGVAENSGTEPPWPSHAFEKDQNCVHYMRNGACRYGKTVILTIQTIIDSQFYQPTGWEDNGLQMEKSSDHIG